MNTFKGSFGTFSLLTGLESAADLPAEALRRQEGHFFQTQGRVVQRSLAHSRLLGDLEDLLNGLGLLHPENLIDFGAIF